MPFTADLHEMKSAYNYFMHVMNKRPELLVPYFPLIKPWLEQHLADPQTYHFRNDFQEKLWHLHSVISQGTSN